MQKKELIKITLFIVTFLCFYNIGNSQVTLRDTVLTFSIKGNEIVIPAKGSVEINTKVEFIETKLNANLNLFNLSQNITSILQTFLDKQNECKESLYVLDSKLYSSNSELFCFIKLRGQYIQCDVPIVDYIKGSDKGTFTIKISPYINENGLGLKAELVEYELSPIIDEIVKKDKIVNLINDFIENKAVNFVSAEFPPSYKRYDFKLSKFKFYNQKDELMVNLQIIGNLSAEEFGRLIQEFGK